MDHPPNEDRKPEIRGLLNVAEQNPEAAFGEDSPDRGVPAAGPPAAATATATAAARAPVRRYARDQPKVWEQKDYPEDSFGMIPQGVGIYHSVLILCAKGTNGQSNVDKIIKDDLYHYFTTEQKSITTHGPKIPNIDLATGRMTDAKGAPPGVQWVAQQACRLMHSIKEQHDYYPYRNQWMPFDYAVNLAQVGSLPIAMVIQSPWDYLDDHVDEEESEMELGGFMSYLKHLEYDGEARLLHVKIPPGDNVGRDYIFGSQPNESGD